MREHSGQAWVWDMALGSSALRPRGQGTWTALLASLFGVPSFPECF